MSQIFEFEESEVDSMSIKQLRSAISSAGLSFADCIEKNDLRARAREACVRLQEAKALREAQGGGGSGGGGGGGGGGGKKFGVFECLTEGDAEKPDLVVVFLHGYGATADNFTDVAQFAKKSPQLASKKVYFVFPQASAGPAGASEWWVIDPMKWMMAMQQGEQGIAKLIREEPPGLPAFRTNMQALLEEVVAFTGVGYDKVVLGGFSQGAMSAMDLALSLPADKTVAGVTVVSGAPIVIEQWTERLKLHKGIKVFVCHGQTDQVLPFVASGWLKQLLTSSGASVRYETHSDGHTLGPHTIISAIMEFWATLG
jgi:phospholipase/carboxylesterase